MTAGDHALVPVQIGSPLDKANVGLFRLKALLGGNYDSLSRPETTTLQRLRVRLHVSSYLTAAGIHTSSTLHLLYHSLRRAQQRYHSAMPHAAAQVPSAGRPSIGSCHAPACIR